MYVPPAEPVRVSREVAAPQPESERAIFQGKALNLPCGCTVQYLRVTSPLDAPAPTFGKPQPEWRVSYVYTCHYHRANPDEKVDAPEEVDALLRQGAREIQRGRYAGTVEIPPAKSLWVLPCRLCEATDHKHHRWDCIYWAVNDRTPFD